MTDWIVKDADIHPINKFPYQEKVFLDYIENIKNLPGSDRMELIRNQSNVYLLIGRKASDGYIREGEKSWEDILPADKYKTLCDNDYIVLAFLLPTVKDDTLHYINLIDTFVKGLNLAKLIIDKYQEYNNDVYAIPKEIISSSAKYWARKYFYCEIIDEETGKKYYDKSIIDDFIKDYELDENELLWDELFCLCSEENSNSDK